MQQTLKLLTCGSVDDGKSTLIGRFLFETGQLYADQLKALGEPDENGELPFANLLDGLEAERSQGITIDVAWRFAEAGRRHLIIADTPGHEQYTRNMVTGASHCDLAIILVDARKGIIRQTRRHSFLCHLLGIRQFVVAVNKMDAVGYDEAVFRDIETQYRALAQRMPGANIQLLPVSALKGDNLAQHSAKMPWYQGPTLLAALEEAEVSRPEAVGTRLPVQLVIRPNQDLRAFAGTLFAGNITQGEHLYHWPSGKEAVVQQLWRSGAAVDKVQAGEAVSVQLDRELDISRGDWLTNGPVTNSRQWKGWLVWLDDAAHQLGKRYRIKAASRWTWGTVAEVSGQLNVDDLSISGETALDTNAIGQVTLQLEEAQALDHYSNSRHTGSLLLVDPDTQQTVAAFMAEEAVEESAANRPAVSAVEKELNAYIRRHYPHWQALDLSDW
ncbi:GTP-binding protein [Gallaecimonas kandeliae]|uniref:sulfate adenylyltransferase subunit 1 n=1 Tax=Gallaecimonas kandeliae TaxID=3029055 RepID=UPI00264A16DD|nr:GTP-binding protein [Gallaecimonas kandeliae]WKE66275.1 GTP-binding protein [Gallaecimonas kandeliae]